MTKGGFQSILEARHCLMSNAFIAELSWHDRKHWDSDVSATLLITLYHTSNMTLVVFDLFDCAVKSLQIVHVVNEDWTMSLTTDHVSGIASSLSLLYAPAFRSSAGLSPTGNLATTTPPGLAECWWSPAHPNRRCMVWKAPYSTIPAKGVHVYCHGLMVSD